MVLRLQNRLDELATLQTALDAFAEGQRLPPQAAIASCFFPASHNSWMRAAASGKPRRAIASRMACTFRMEALTQDETKALLARRLETAKAPKDLFADDAMELLAAQSRGNRRELMNLGVMLCIEAHSREEKSITAELVLAKAPLQ